ncbi:MAG: nucleotide exchange factor GrpE [Phycisphaerae bacterium]
MSQTTSLGINGDHHWPRRSIPIRSALPEDLATHLASVTTDLAGMKALLETTLTAVTQLAGKVSTLAAEVTELKNAQEILAQKADQTEALNQQLKLLSAQHYTEHVLGPLTTYLFDLVDFVGDFLVDTLTDNTTAVEVLKGARDKVIELLATYGISIVFAEPGTAFDPKTMRPIRRVKASAPSTLKVKRTVRCGWRRDLQVLRPAFVEFLPAESTESQ